MEVFNGSDLVLVIETSAGNYKPIAGAKQFTLTVTRTIRDVSHKHVGPAQKNEYGRYNWNVSIEGLVSYYTSFVNHDWFLEQQLAKNKVKIITSLLDYQTAGKAPLAQDTALAIADSGDLAVIDADTTSIQCSDNHFATNSVISALTPKANYGQAVIESVEKTAGDDDNPTFSVSLKGDGQVFSFDIVSTAGYSAEYQAVYNAFINKPTASVANAQNTLVESLKTAGYWATRDCFFALAVHTDSDDDSLIDWISPTGTKAQNIGGAQTCDFLAYFGYTSKSAYSAVIDTQFVPSTDGVNYTLNDASYMIYTNTNTDGNIVSCGIDDGSNDAWLFPRNSDSCNSRVNDGTTDFNANTDSSGCFIVNRTGASATETFRNGVSLGTSTNAATALPAYSFHIGGRNNSGTTASVDNREHAFFSAGGSVADAAEALAVYNAINTYLTAVQP